MQLITNWRVPISLATEIHNLIDLLAIPLRNTPVYYLPTNRQVVHYRHSLFQRAVRIKSMTLVDVDIIQIQSPERVVHLLQYMFSRKPTPENSRADRGVHFRGDDILFPWKLRQRSPEDNLRLTFITFRINICGIEQVHARIESSTGPRYGLLAPTFSAMRQPSAQRYLGNLQAPFSNSSILQDQPPFPAASTCF